MSAKMFLQLCVVPSLAIRKRDHRRFQQGRLEKQCA